jgi:hypothetical protein
MTRFAYHSATRTEVVKGAMVFGLVWRRLLIFAFDPNLSARFETAGIGKIPILVPWEERL